MQKTKKKAAEKVDLAAKEIMQKQSNDVHQLEVCKLTILEFHYFKGMALQYIRKWQWKRKLQSWNKQIIQEDGYLLPAVKEWISDDKEQLKEFMEFMEAEITLADTALEKQREMMKQQVF